MPFSGQDCQPNAIAHSADAILEPLTDAQREAVVAVEGPLLILAGPGSGKTRVITHRIAYMLDQGISARNIIALTFTNKAAEEMQSRLERLAPGQPVWMSTFHRFCSRLLRSYAPLAGLSENFTIYDASDSQRALKRVMEETTLSGPTYRPERIAGEISWAKNNLIAPGDYQPRARSALGGVTAEIYPRYQEDLLRANAVDFDDLLMHSANLLQQNPDLRAMLDERYQYILVDEYQDTNFAQYALVRSLSIDHPNLAVTGDPDQSIYGWRGANLSNILDFEKDYSQVRVVRLEQNYRSTKNILRAADALIAHNRKRKKKRLFTDNDDGPSVKLNVFPTHREEAEAIADRVARAVESGERSLRDFAIFYRTNALSRTLEDALRNRGIAHQIVGGLAFYQRREVKDVLAYLQLLNNPRNDVAFERVVNTPARGIGKKTFDRLSQYARREGLPLLEAARQAGVIESIAKRTATKVARFVALFDGLHAEMHAPVEKVLGAVLSDSGYREFLQQADQEKDEERIANIEELLSAAREFDERHNGPGAVEAFLEQVALVADIDGWEETSDRLTMMTLHAAKGLEFPCVFITAVEQGLLPHERSLKDDDAYEEERRLLFVGITRAQEELRLSNVVRRLYRGGIRPAIASPFLMEMAAQGVEVEDFSNDLYVDAEIDDFRQTPPEPEPPRRPADPFASLKTAASMLSDDEAQGAQGPLTPPEAFRHGMLVTHPEYGPGKIVALSGSGKRRTAEIDFATCGRRSMVLAFSPLKPAGG